MTEAVGERYISLTRSPLNLCNRATNPLAHELLGLRLSFSAEGVILPVFKIIPNVQDYAAIDVRCGRLPDDASYDERLKRFQLAQNIKLVRLWEHGLLPVEMMREMDRIFGTNTIWH